MDQGIGRWIYKNAEINGSRPALADKGRRVTYLELDKRTNKLARALQGAGVRQGDRVALLATNSIAFLETIFAIAKVGGIAVPINYRLSAREVEYNLSDSGAMLLVYSESLSELAHDALSGPGIRVALSLEIGRGDAPDGKTTPVQCFEDFLNSGDAEALDCFVSRNDTAMILYTSGTTGRPKGAMLSHEAFYTNSIHAMLTGSGMSKYDVTVTPCPLFHMGGLGVHTLPLLYVGGMNYLQEAFDPQETLAAMSREAATLQFLVSVMWTALSRVPDFNSHDLTPLRFAVSGGAPCPLTVIEYLQAQGVMLLDGFGMTETASSTILLDIEHAVSKRGSVGRPLMHVDARIVDDRDSAVAVGEVGELVLKGTNLFTSYWGLPEATKEAWRGGWFHTGDLAKVDKDGFYTLVDRKKDMLITGGENVYPVEVEQVLHRHPQIKDVAVIGLPDARWGEAVVAVIVPLDGETLEPDEVISFSREQLAHFKCPKRVEIVETLPRNTTGKILKGELRKAFSGFNSSVVR